MQLTPEQVAQFAEDSYLLRGALTRSSPSARSVHRSPRRDRRLYREGLRG